MPRYLIASLVVVALFAACGGSDESGLSGNDDDSVTLSNGDVMTESRYQDHLAALIDDLGYATVCHELRLPDDLGESSPTDRERIIVLYREVCDRHAEQSR